MSRQQNKSTKGGKIVGTLLFLSIALIIIGIVVVLIPPVKTVKSFTISSGNHENIPLQIAEGDQVDCEMDLGSGDVTVYFFTAENYAKYLLGTYIYEWSIVYDGGSFSTTQLHAGTYHVVVDLDTGSSASGSISYWISPAVNPANAFLVGAIIFAAVMWVMTIVVAKRQGMKVKVWDPKQQKYI